MNSTHACVHTYDIFNLTVVINRDQYTCTLETPFLLQL